MTRSLRVSRIAQTLVAACALATLVLTPALASAAPSVATTANPLGGPAGSFPTPGVWQTADITFHPEGETSGPVLLIGGTLLPKVKLPVVVSLSAPAGTQVGWTGEVFGGDPAKDIEASSTIVALPGYQQVVFALTKARSGQTEVGYPQGLTSTGGLNTAAFSWTADQAYPQVRAAIRVPAGAKVSTATPDASVQKGADGSTYYVLERTSVKKGQTLALSVVYTPGPATAAASTTGTGTASSGNTGVIVFIIIVIVLLLVAILVIQSRGSAGQATPAAPAAKRSPAGKSAGAAKSGQAGKSGKSEPSSKAPRPAAPKARTAQPEEPPSDEDDPFSQA